MRLLSLRTLGTLPAGLAPAFDPAGLGVGIVHLGLGAFHRAHQALCTQEAIVDAGGAWGICGVSERSSAVRMRLEPQDGLFAVLERGPGEPRTQVIGAVREVLCAPTESAAVVARIADPATHVVTLTVTEKGYHLDPATGTLALEDPEVARDLSGRPPRTPVGQLAAGLDARQRAGARPLTIVPCDNLADNGPTLRSLVQQMVQRRPDGGRVLEWMAANAGFASTMVDRIVPATTEADRTTAAALLGLRDEGTVVGEPFRQWVIEDAFAGPRPAWERAGALLTDDVRPYERAKVRLLNGSHSMIAYLGQLAGYELVSAVMIADSPIVAAVCRLMSDDVLPTLGMIEGLDLTAYREQLLERFANPGLAHRTAQIAIDGSQKLPPRLLGTVADRRASAAEPMAALLGIAAWMRCVADRVRDDGRRLTIEDPLASVIEARMTKAGSAAAVVEAMLGVREVFPEELAGDPVVREILVEHLNRLRRDGAEAAARHVARP